MRLLLVELTRFRSRRAIALLAVAAFLLAVVLAGATAWESRPLTAADRADAAAQADLAAEDAQTVVEVRACEARPSDYLGPEATAGDCAEALVPGVEAFYPREQLSISSTLRGHGIELALVVVGLMVIAGCTFAGADWASGSLTNQLLFEPRRGRLWLAKAGAVVLGTGLVTLVTVAGFWVAIGLVAGGEGLTLPSADVGHVAWHVVRTVALGMGAGLGGFALTMIFRHTVATLALLFVYAVGGEILVNLLPFEGAGRWSVGNNTYGWLARSHSYLDSSIDCAPGERCSQLQVMTHLEAGSFLLVILVVAVALSLLSFRRRDV
jgi:hypothetical protein